MSSNTLRKVQENKAPNRHVRRKTMQGLTQRSISARKLDIESINKSNARLDKEINIGNKSNVRLDREINIDKRTWQREHRQLQCKA